MTLYVYITSNCYKDTANHNLSNEIEKISRRVQSNQNLAGFEILRPTSFAKKSLGRSFRLLTFTKREIPSNSSTDSIIFFLRALPRGDKEYEWFLKNYQSNRAETESKFFGISDSDISRIYSDLVRSNVTSEVKYPSSNENKWLYEVFAESYTDLDGDLLVLESKEWVQAMLTRSTQDFRALCQKFLENLEIQKLEKTEESETVQYEYDENQEIGIIYALNREARQILLLSPIVYFSEVEVEEKKKEFEKKIKDIQDIEQLKDQIFLRLAVRSYPYLMVLDRDTWLEIQRDQEANLALSPEEGELLKSIRRADIQEEGFPLFINGRAGSGKSTMLQYLATDYVDFALRQEIEP